MPRLPSGHFLSLEVYYKPRLAATLSSTFSSRHSNHKNKLLITLFELNNSHGDTGTPLAKYVIVQLIRYQPPHLNGRKQRTRRSCDDPGHSGAHSNCQRGETVQVRTLPLSYNLCVIRCGALTILLSCPYDHALRSTELGQQVMEWGLHDAGFSYHIVAVCGSQSTGKSEFHFHFGDILSAAKMGDIWGGVYAPSGHELRR